jgi:hypothetical protein
MSEPITEQQRQKNQKQNLGCIAVFIGLAIAAYFFWPAIFNKSKQQPVTQSESVTSTSDPYNIIEGAFEGRPSKGDVQPMLESVMKTYKMEITDNNIMAVGSMLVDLRKASKIGVTEMAILKHIYQKGSSALSLPQQAAISATILEKTK